MHPIPLFLQRCEQVHFLLETHRELEILDLAARLRQLLIDKHSLVSTVNTNKVKLRFDVGHFRDEPDPYEAYVTFQSLEDGVDPETSHSGRRKTLNLGEFLAHHVMTILGERKTVKDVIRHVSNVAGGVHHDPNPKEEYHLLQQVAAVFSIGGLPAGIRVVKAIGRVTLRGLQPLLDDVRAR